jgi:hypothetical protein
MKRSSLPGTEKKRPSLSDIKNDTFKTMTSAPAAPMISSPSSILWGELRRELMDSSSITAVKHQRSMSMTSASSAQSPSSTMKRCKSLGEKRRASVATIMMPTNLESDGDDDDDDDDAEHDAEDGDNSGDDGESGDVCTTERCVLPTQARPIPLQSSMSNEVKVVNDD